jgi:hypothetical protein
LKLTLCPELYLFSDHRRELVEDGLGLVGNAWRREICWRPVVSRADVFDRQDGAAAFVHDLDRGRPDAVFTRRTNEPTGGGYRPHDQLLVTTATPH